VSGRTITTSLVADPTFLFGRDNYVLTGKASGDISGITNFIGAIDEAHLRTPNATLTSVTGLQTHADIDATATGATVTSIFSLAAMSPANTAGATVTKAYGIYSEGIPTPGATNYWGLYVDHGGPTFLSGQTTINPNSDTVGLIVKQFPAQAARMQVWQNAFAGSLAHVDSNGAFASNSFITAFEGVSAQSQIGFTGPSGQAGLKLGSAGDTVVYRQAAGVLGTTGAIQFGSGGSTADGTRLWSGSGAPNISASAAGDFYLRTDTPTTANQRLYVATAVNAWTGIV
jgi:hypothetical protein